MLKKLLVVFFILLIFFNFAKSEAFLNKTEKAYNESVTYEDLYVVSEYDFKDNLKLQMTGGLPNTFYDLSATWSDQGYLTFVTSTTTTSTGTLTLSVPHSWVRWTPTSATTSKYIVEFVAKQNGTEI